MFHSATVEEKERPHSADDSSPGKPPYRITVLTANGRSLPGKRYSNEDSVITDEREIRGNLCLRIYRLKQAWPSSIGVNDDATIFGRNDNNLHTLEAVSGVSWAKAFQYLGTAKHGMYSWNAHKNDSGSNGDNFERERFTCKFFLFVGSFALSSTWWRCDGMAMIQ